MRFALVVGAAPEPDCEEYYRSLLAEATHVVAADAGGEWCVRLGRVPDITVGDFDGSDAGAPERLVAAGSRVIAHPEDKDETDLELAVDVALETFGEPLVLAAAFTRRLDHTLAAFGALMRAGAGACARERAWSAHVVTPDRPLALRASEGTIVSVLAPGGALGVDVMGTRWTLAGATLEPLSGHGISNEAAGGDVSVSCAEGALIVFVETRIS